mgnify:CR=1 FL=1
MILWQYKLEAQNGIKRPHGKSEMAQPCGFSAILKKSNYAEK